MDMVPDFKLHFLWLPLRDVSSYTKHPAFFSSFFFFFLLTLIQEPNPTGCLVLDHFQSGALCVALLQHQKKVAITEKLFML